MLAKKSVPLKKQISHDWETLREHVSRLSEAEGFEHSCKCAACQETLSHLHDKAVALHGVLKHVRLTRKLTLSPHSSVANISIEF